MPTPRFNALVDKVRNWVNRDPAVLSDALITDFLDYSADYCYRKLRIPPLEYVYQYPVITSDEEGETSLQIPPDFTELISFSRIDANGKRYVLSKKLDEQSFTDEYTIKPKNSFAYKHNNIVFYPKAAIGETFELHYYRRLFDLDATYAVNQNNIDSELCVAVEEDDLGAVEFPEDSGNYYAGNDVYNWLRDENERTLLFGAIAFAFDYLGETEKAMGYYQKIELGIQELNQEEKYRKAKGAVNTVTFEVSELL